MKLSRYELGLIYCGLVGLKKECEKAGLHFRPMDIKFLLNTIDQELYPFQFDIEMVEEYTKGETK